MGLSRAIFGLGTALLLGCAPRLSSLLADRHYREALAYASHTNGADDERVADAILRDLAPQVHVAVGQIAPLEGHDPEASIVRVRVATNVVPIPHDFLSVDSAGKGALPVASAGTLASTLGETILRCHEVEPSAVGAVAGGILTVLTLGVIGPPSSRPYTVCPTDAERSRAAPRTTAIAPELKNGCKQADGRLQCTYDFLMPGSAAVPKMTAAPMSFVFRFSFAVQLPGSSRSRLARTFTVDRQYELVIPTVLPAESAQPLGRTFRPLSEVAQRQ